MNEPYRGARVHATRYITVRSSPDELGPDAAQRRQLQQGDTDGTVAILIIVILVFIIIWYVQLPKCSTVFGD
jgi:hypothetical protein